MTDPHASPPPPPRRRWMVWALTASLAVNLVVIGLVAGAALSLRSGSEERRSYSSLRALGLSPYTRAMAKEDWHALRARARAEAPREGPTGERSALRAEVRRTIAALRAEPFEPETLAASLAAQHAIGEERARFGRRLLVDHVTEMTPQERAAFATRLEERMARFERRAER